MDDGEILTKVRSGSFEFRFGDCMIEKVDWDWDWNDDCWLRLRLRWDDNLLWFDDMVEWTVLFLQYLPHISHPNHLS